MELFKTTGVLDEMVLKEVAKKGILKSEKGAAISCFLLCLVFSAAGYSALAAVFFSFGLFLVLWQLFLFKRITIKNNLCVMQEFNGVTEYQYTTWFDEEGVVCRLPRYLTKPRQRRNEWDMAGSDGISRVSAVFRGKSLLTNKMRII